MEQVISKDGTRIAYERTGSGPPLILVDGAFCSRAFGPSSALAPLLSRRFTVIRYDRRGRNESGDTAPYAKERELEDLEALIAATGDRPALVGLSSGAGLALEAAAGLPIRAVVAWEPPYVEPAGSTAGRRHDERIQELLRDGRRGAAVAYFMHDMVDAPMPVVWMMRLMPWIWRKLTAVAHTLPYDVAVMGDFTAPTERFSRISVPAWVGFGGKTVDKIKSAARVIAEAIPGAQLRELAGQNHAVRPAALTSMVEEFLAA
ncbi:MAG: alpha/beta hydrolase [Myxococcaceae bacterium]|nr:alpha/beta hydrolase [Myxococcaceae bacterium]